jgi:hypothetical protein
VLAGDALRQPGIEGHDPADGRRLAGGVAVAEGDVVDLVRRDPGPLQQSLSAVTPRSTAVRLLNIAP